jgi:hypothetical protein
MKLFTAAAGFAVAATFFNLRARCRVHFTAVTAFGFLAAVGAVYGVGVFINQFFKIFAASGATVLQDGHSVSL